MDQSLARSVFPSKEATGEAIKRPAQTRAFSGASFAPGGQPCISFVTLGPFAGGRCSLKAWPRIRRQIEEGSKTRPGPCSYMAEIVGSLV